MEYDKLLYTIPSVEAYSVEVESGFFGSMLEDPEVQPEQKW